MPWGAKKKSTETKLELLEVSAKLLRCAISLTHSCIQKLESEPAMLPATTLTENFVKPTPDEVSAKIMLRNLIDTQLYPETGK